MSGGVKNDQYKERFDLLPPRPLFLLTKVYTQGAKKYTDRNWEKGMKWGRIFGAIQRHLWKFWMGEDYDKETGVPHVINAAWGCITLCEYMFTHPELDDRPEIKESFNVFKEKFQEMFNNGTKS